MPQLSVALAYAPAVGCVTSLRRIVTVALAVLTQAFAVLGSLAAQASIVSDWNETTLVEVRLSKFGPPIVARALAIAHTCMYDAWSAYDPIAVGTALSTSYRRPYFEHTDRNKATAISYAAYRCLLNLFPDGASRLRRMC
jgi:hypothetical protein